MVAVEHMHGCFVVATKLQALFERYHLVVSAVDNFAGTVERWVAERGQPRHVQRWRHQKNRTRVQQRGRCDRHVAAHATADQHQLSAKLLAIFHQLFDACDRRIDAAIIDGGDGIAFARGDFRQCGNFLPPRTGFLSMRKHNVTTGHAAVSSLIA